ncbi:putative nuclease HARBI1 [Lineus longissimus]|uniref:putative nuclease HARBI1 n=1 Tax=Lineus longissimus TaxID=88925 RepID=UPI00315C61FF
MTEHLLTIYASYSGGACAFASTGLQQHCTDMFMRIRQQKVYKNRIDRDEISPATYRKLFRFEKENVEWLAATFLPDTVENRGGCMTPLARMETTLHYLADPGYQTSVAELMGVTQPTVSNCVSSTINSIAEQHPRWIIFPFSDADATLAKERWADKLGFPFTLGAIDCTHVRIDKPGGPFGDEFINRKNFASFNVQATCDEKWSFTSADVGWPGSVHDSRIFQTSELHALVSRNVHGVLLGDSGYGIAPYMMTPFTDPNTPAERYFNREHAKNRVVIEQAFGQLKRRFPILRYGVRLKLDNVPKCIISCFVLHNIAKVLNDADDFDDEEQEHEVDDQGQEAPAPLAARQLRLQGNQKRQEITNFLYDRHHQRV